MRQAALLLTVILLAVPLTGCLEGDDGEDPGADTVSIAWIDQPADAAVGETIPVSWNVSGPSREIQHTAIHWSDRSVPNPSTPADYGNTTGAQEPATIPGTFDAELSFDTAGTYHVRGHAIVEGNHIWTSEVTIDVEADEPEPPSLTVTLTTAPTEATAGSPIEVAWNVSGGSGEIDHTGFHWANTSVADPQSPADYGNTTGAQEPAQIPGSFNGSFTIEQAGTIHARAHALVNGTHFWSEETTITVTEPPAPEPTPNVTVEIQDTGAAGLFGTMVTFNPETVEIEQGGEVIWENKGNSTYSVDFSDENLEGSPDIAPGESWTWTVPADLEPSSYEYTEPSQNTDATGTVEVTAAS